MTGKEMCGGLARQAFPELAQELIDKVSVAIWNASPTGELWHIFVLEEIAEQRPQDLKVFVKQLVLKSVPEIKNL